MPESPLPSGPSVQTPGAGDARYLSNGVASFEAIPLPAYLVQQVAGDFVLRAVNRVALAANPGLPQLIGQPLSPLYSDQPWLRADVEQCLRQGSMVTRDTAVRRPIDNVSRPMRVTFSSISSDCVLICWQDLTPLYASEAALAASEDHFRRVVETAQEGVWSCDLTGRTISANERMAAMLGCPLPELLQASVFEFAVESFHPLLRDRLERRRRGVGGIEEIAYQRRDGAILWARVAAAPIVRDQVVVGVLAMITDITPLKASALELRSSQDRLRLALRAARMGTWEWDLHTNTGTWSRDMEALFRREGTADSFEGFLSLVHPDDFERVAELGQKLLTPAHNEPIEVEFRLLRLDGDARWVNITGQQLLDDDGRPRIVGTIADVSDRKRLEEQLTQAQKLESVGRLAGGVAHDFNNLLTVILTTLHMAQKTASGELATDLATIRTAADRARDLTRQLLAFARKQIVSVRTVELVALITDVQRLLSRILGEDITLTVGWAPDLWPVRADEAQLSQVLLNLAANARDAMPSGGRLTLDAANVEWAALPMQQQDALTRGDYVRLAMTDTGSGIDETTRRHLFEPFFTTKRMGTGLGLASSYGIIKQLGGDIAVESEPGVGARFLPGRRCQRRPPRGARRRSSSSRTRTWCARSSCDS
jgi:PAS domain S-box-containing protein